MAVFIIGDFDPIYRKKKVVINILVPGIYQIEKCPVKHLLNHFVYFGLIISVD
jgi:hypothetical protein